MKERIEKALDELEIALIVQNAVQEIGPKLIREVVTEAVKGTLGWEFQREITRMVKAWITPKVEAVPDEND